MKRTLIIYNTKETTQEEAAHLLNILNCDDSMIWDNADRCGVEIIEVPTDSVEEDEELLTEPSDVLGTMTSEDTSMPVVGSYSPFGTLHVSGGVSVNPLDAPANYTLQELFAELKRGRPAASQKYLDKCIAELNEQEIIKTEE